MRLIDADKLIKSVNEDKFTKYCKQMNVPLDDELQVDGFHIGLVEGAIYLQPTVEIPQWIPCSERLPEENGFYLITFKNGLVEYLFFDNEQMDWYFVADGSEEDNTSWRELAKEVIAWQPLPQPYTKNREES